MSFSKDHILVGIGIGLVVPFVGYALLLTIFDQLQAIGWVEPNGLSPTFRQRTLSVLAICLNIIPINFFKRKWWNESMRGVVFPTGLYVIAWIIYFGKYIL